MEAVMTKRKDKSTPPEEKRAREMGRVEAICISRKKGATKKPVDRARFIVDWGIDGDAHAGEGDRQVSLLAGERIDQVRTVLPDLEEGAFAENIIARHIQLSGIKVGDRLGLGDTVLLEITQIGKECHDSGCPIMKATGDCIMPREGLFARVLRGGMVRKGDALWLSSM
jgi:MOSC domain-containing protein YiiM